MFDFDDYENLDDYIFTYPALDILRRKYVKWLKKHPPHVAPWEYRNKLLEYTKTEIVVGRRKYGEIEPEWEQLLYYTTEIEKDFKNSDVDALYKIIILYDQALILLYEGNPLPSNLLT